MNKYLLVIPLYNEEEHIKDVISKVREYFSGEILVINDGSTDKSSEILAEIKDIEVIEQIENCGYGCVLMNGFKHAVENNFDVVLLGLRLEKIEHALILMKLMMHPSLHLILTRLDFQLRVEPAPVSHYTPAQATGLLLQQAYGDAFAPALWSVFVLLNQYV